MTGGNDEKRIQNGWASRGIDKKSIEQDPGYPVSVK